jgi:hypothetical protein
MLSAQEHLLPAASFSSSMNTRWTQASVNCQGDQSLPESTSRSRRRFLKETFLGFSILTATKFFPRAIVQNLVPDDVVSRLRFFSEQEYMLVQTVAARMIGDPPLSSGGQQPSDTALRADEYLSLVDPEIQQQFHQLLTVFNGLVFAFLFDFRFSSFLDMKPDDQDSYLQDWMTSTLTFRRQVFVALKRLSVSMYYTDHRSWGSIGYTGLFLPWERP